MEFWYPLAFLLTLISLTLWLLYQQESWGDLFRWSFWGGLAGYLVTLASAEVAAAQKLQLAFGDLLVLALAPLVAVFLYRTTGSRLLPLLGLFFFSWTYRSVLTQRIAAPPPSTAISAADDRQELLVELQNGLVPASLGPALPEGLTWERAFYPADAEATLLDNFYLVDVPNGTDWRGVLAALEAHPLVVYAEDNEVVVLDDSESRATRLIDVAPFGLNDPGLGRQWGFQSLLVNELFDDLRRLNLKAERPALVAILDTGVDARHEDLTDNYVSLNSKYDRDPKGHGTHCAGVAAAVSNNGKGIAGFSQDNSYVRVTSVTVLNPFGMGTQESIIDGILEAADAKADVISLSLGARARVPSQRAYREAVKYANKKGAIVVAAAGNNGGDARQLVPAGVEGVIAVSATDTLNRKAGFSNFVNHVDMGLAAPGTLVYSTIPGDKYAAYNGTSMAAPHVAGIVGLLKSLRPELTTAQVFTLLDMTGKETADTRATGKLVQPGAAVRYLAQD